MIGGILRIPSRCAVQLPVVSPYRTIFRTVSTSTTSPLSFPSVNCLSHRNPSSYNRSLCSTSLLTSFSTTYRSYSATSTAPLNSHNCPRRFMSKNYDDLRRKAQQAVRSTNPSLQQQINTQHASQREMELAGNKGDIPFPSKLLFFGAAFISVSWFATVLFDFHMEFYEGKTL